MGDDAMERALWVWTASELGAIVVLLGLLTASVVGEATFWSSASRRLRLAAIAVLAMQLLAPLWVFYDLRRRGDGSSSMWIHVAAMPLLNVFGLVAYLDYRRRSSAE